MSLYLFLTVVSIFFFCVFFFKQKTAYEMRISDWSSDVCSSDLWRSIAIAIFDILLRSAINKTGSRSPIGSPVYIKTARELGALIRDARRSANLTQAELDRKSVV